MRGEVAGLLALAVSGAVSAWLIWNFGVMALLVLFAAGVFIASGELDS